MNPENENAWIYLDLEPNEDTEEFIVQVEMQGVPGGVDGLLKVLKSLVTTLETIRIVEVSMPSGKSGK